MAKGIQLYRRRRQRIRNKIRKNNKGRVRLSVHRTNKHIYAQVIDDESGKTLAAVSSLEKVLRGELGSGSTLGAAQRVGALIAERAAAAGIKEVIFDRGGFLYHGRVRAVAEGAREGGLNL